MYFMLVYITVHIISVHRMALFYEFGFLLEFCFNLVLKLPALSVNTWTKTFCETVMILGLK